jgi:hypothetical protein
MDLTATNSDASSSPLPAQRRASSIPSLISIDSLPSDYGSDGNDNIISRMCGRQWKLNSDEEGQYKFFGPTSSLHLTESVSSSLLESGFSQQMPEDGTLDGMIDHDTHCHLLEIYWKYQHTILQVFDKEIFLEGLKTRHGKYFSKALLFAVYACAARISDRPGLRAMVVPAHDDLSHNEPCLVAMAAGLVNDELQRPRVTTIQALLLLSVIYCSLGKDTKGWISTGRFPWSGALGGWAVDSFAIIQVWHAVWPSISASTNLATTWRQLNCHAVISKSDGLLTGDVWCSTGKEKLLLRSPPLLPFTRPADGCGADCGRSILGVLLVSGTKISSWNSPDPLVPTPRWT